MESCRLVLEDNVTVDVKEIGFDWLKIEFVD
jgi:hypothetical protein